MDAGYFPNFWLNISSISEMKQILVTGGTGYIGSPAAV